MDSLQERLEDAAQTPAKPPYKLATLIQVSKALHCICLTQCTNISLQAGYMRATNSGSKQLLYLQEIRLRTGRPVLLLEIVKPSPSSKPEDVGALAAQVTS